MTPELIKKRDELGEVAAKVYAREFGGFPKGTSLIAVNGHTRGWNEGFDAAVALLEAEKGEVDLAAFDRGFVAYHDGLIEMCKQRKISVIPVRALDGYLRNFLPEDCIKAARDNHLRATPEEKV